MRTAFAPAGCTPAWLRASAEQDSARNTEGSCSAEDRSDRRFVNQDSLVAFICGYEIGSRDRCRIGKQLSSYLETKGFKHYATGWPGQVGEYAKASGKSWEDAFLDVLNQVLDAIEPTGRELLECPDCDLVEDLRDGRLITYQPNDNSFFDGGLRFLHMGEAYRCPACKTEF